MWRMFQRTGRDTNPTRKGGVGLRPTDASVPEDFAADTPEFRINQGGANPFGSLASVGLKPTPPLRVGLVSRPVLWNIRHNFASRICSCAALVALLAPR